MIVPSRVVWGCSLLSGLISWLVGLGASWVFALVIPFIITAMTYANRVS